MTMLSEAEIQYLIVRIELEQPVETENNNFYTFYPKTVEEAARYFKGFRLDWEPAYPTLLERGLICCEADGYALSEAGREAAKRVRLERPPIYYWYREFYSLAPRSRAYAEFCTRLYGQDLSQAGFSDMQQIDKLASILQLTEGSRVLELGCGLGRVAETLSDRSGAHVTGVDYCPDAILQAQERSLSRRSRLEFRLGNLDDLDFPPASFDRLVSIDTLYMPNNLDSTLRRMVWLTRPGGCWAIFYTQFAWGQEPPGQALLPENTPLGKALWRLGLRFETWDFSAATYQLMQRKRQTGEAMRADFESEGSQVLLDFILAESESSLEPYNPEMSRMARYLFRVSV